MKKLLLVLVLSLASLSNFAVVYTKKVEIGFFTIEEDSFKAIAKFLVEINADRDSSVSELIREIKKDTHPEFETVEIASSSDYVTVRSEGRVGNGFSRYHVPVTTWGKRFYHHVAYIVVDADHYYDASVDNLILELTIDSDKFINLN